MRVLVTGSQGFVGKHLVARLETLGHQVLATDRAQGARWRLELPDDDGTETLFAAAEPDVVFHLAAVAAVPASQAGPDYAYRVNVDGTRSVANAVLRRPQCRLIFVSSAAVYGPVGSSTLPVREEQGCRPNNVYGWSKLGCEALLSALFAERPMQTTILRPFNHSGPGQDTGFALADFAHQIAELEQAGQPGVIRTGDLDVTRDFLDVRDVIEAYIAVLETPDLSGTFNVCSGNGYRVGDLAEKLCGLADVEVRLEQDPSLLRAVETRAVVGDAGALRAATGWRPRVPIDETLADLLGSWRERVARAPLA